MISKDSVVLKQAKNFKKINLDQIKKKSVELNADTIVQLNRDQMRGSQTGGGLLPEYSQTTLELKDFSNYRGIFPRFDLFDQGDFQDRMFLIADTNNVLISSKDPKTDDLVLMLGEEIFELNSQNLELAQKAVTLDYNKEVHKQINR